MEEKNELQVESKKKHLDNIERELKLIAEQKPELEAKKVLLEKEVANVKARQEIILNNYVKKKIDWAFEEIPRYLELMKEFEGIIFDKKASEYATAAKQIDANLDAMDIQLKSLAEEKIRITKELEELEEDK